MAPLSGYVGASRLDPTLVGRAYDPPPNVASDGFPYDRDDDGGDMTVQRVPSFGGDRGGGRREPNHTQPTPRRRPGDTLSGFEEAMGVPFSFGMSNKSDMGGTMPGADGGFTWATSPTKPWDEDDDDASEGSVISPDTKVLGGSGFGMGLGRTNPSGRGFMQGWTEDSEPRSSWDDALDLLKDLPVSADSSDPALPKVRVTKMKIDIESLRKVVGKMVSEAKKKKGKAKVEEPKVRNDAHVRDPRLDFSKPLGAENTYRLQGGANFGPYTGDADAIVTDGAPVNLEMSRYGTRMGESAGSWEHAARLLAARETSPKK